jgi:hypothetical protein
MRYRGIEYNVLQGIERSTWIWTVRLEDGRVKSGSERSRTEAFNRAEHAINIALAPPKQRQS